MGLVEVPGGILELATGGERPMLKVLEEPGIGRAIGIGVRPPDAIALDQIRGIGSVDQGLEERALIAHHVPHSATPPSQLRSDERSDDFLLMVIQLFRNFLANWLIVRFIRPWRILFLKK
ncbi:hypothetical protein KKD80_00545 [Patescibacteria group bacterium]|nr:hypothetical protein [Patescibacteria group bacterium]